MQRRLAGLVALAVPALVALAALAALAGPMVSVASAAFPAGNGMLAVAPLHGGGVFVTDTRGGNAERVCPSACGRVTGPRWSPDGRAIAFSTSTGIDLIYSNGSCQSCSIAQSNDLAGVPAAGSHPAYTANPSLVTYVSSGALVQAGIDGLFKATILSHGVSDAVWSGQGELAIVRSGRVWAGRPGHLRRISRGSDPSWSPLGRRIAFAHNGWVMVARLGHRARRLVRGGAPAWSPDGKSIAFIAKHHHVRITGASGGHNRPVGGVQGRSVDWEPVSATPPAGCIAPPGSSVLASAPGAVVTSDTAASPPVDGGNRPTAYMGCLTADGGERLLQSFTFSSYDYEQSVTGAAAAGNYVALVNATTDPHYGGSSYTVAVYDLRTGAQVPDRGREMISCPDYEYTCSAQMNQLALGSNGFSAVHTLIQGGSTCSTLSPSCTVEQIIVHDSAGVQTLDSATQPEPSAPVLTGLRLSGDTLTWEHAGTPESAQLN